MLHSFPTRRSSDLRSSGTTSLAKLASSNWPSAHTLARRTRGEAEWTPFCSAGVDAGSSISPRAQAAIAAGDRKSTRLNSSHSYISYAVFCLKKKKIIIYGLCFSFVAMFSSALDVLPKTSNLINIIEGQVYDPNHLPYDNFYV